MRSIQSGVTYQNPSDSIRFFRIASNRPIVRSTDRSYNQFANPLKNRAMGHRLKKRMFLKLTKTCLHGHKKILSKVNSRFLIYGPIELQGSCPINITDLQKINK